MLKGLLDGITLLGVVLAPQNDTMVRPCKRKPAQTGTRREVAHTMFVEKNKAWQQLVLLAQNTRQQVLRVFQRTRQKRKARACFMEETPLSDTDET